MYDSMRKTTTAKISSHVCSARNPMACPAAFKKKETIEPRTPGRSEAVFGDFCQPVSQIFAFFVQILVNNSDDRADSDTSSNNDHCQRHSIFFEDFYDPLTKWKRSFSYLNLRFKTRYLLVSFRHFSFRVISFRR